MVHDADLKKVISVGVAPIPFFSKGRPCSAHGGPLTSRIKRTPSVLLIESSDLLEKASHLLSLLLLLSSPPVQARRQISASGASDGMMPPPQPLQVGTCLTLRRGGWLDVQTEQWTVEVLQLVTTYPFFVSHLLT